jgi:hypothetical protein
MKPKTNRKTDQNESQGYDRCQTPAYALDPLVPFLRKDWLIWEPAAGEERMISNTLLAHGFDVLSTDIIDVLPCNFFNCDLPRFDIIVTNPPYSIKPEWIERCYRLGWPFALLVPVETIGSGRVQAMMDHYGVELLLLNKRVNFKMPNLGWGGNGAQFPVLWYCWRLLPRPIVYGKITRRSNEQVMMEL